MIEKQPEISIQSSQQKQRIQNVLHKQNEREWFQKLLKYHADNLKMKWKIDGGWQIFMKGDNFDHDQWETHMQHHSLVPTISIFLIWIPFIHVCFWLGLDILVSCTHTEYFSCN